MPPPGLASPRSSVKATPLLNQLPKHSDTSGYLFAICGILLFSMKPILVKIAYAWPIDSITLMTLRMGFSLPMYLAIGLYLVVNNRVNFAVTGSVLPGILLTGVTGYYGAAYFDLTGLHYISAQLERLILFAYPSLVVIIGYFAFGNQVQRGTVPALVLTYTGIVTLFAHDISLSGSEYAFGGMLVFISAFLFAMYILFSKPLIGKTGSMVFTCVSMGAASMAILLHFMISNDLADLKQPGEVYLTAFAIALFSTVLPSFLVNEAINRIGANATSIIGSSGAVITSFLAVVILGENFTVFHVIALVFVTGGIIWLGRVKDKTPV